MNTVIAASSTRTFTISNTGTANLTFSGIASSNGVFVISGSPASPILPGNSVTFDVIFTPTALGLVSSTISFTNNDSNENPYDFVVSGTGIATPAPEANVQGNGVSIVDGDTTPDAGDFTLFVNPTVGNTSTRTFTIQNTGDASLTLGAFTSSDATFTIPSPPAGPIAAGNSVTFDVVFTPTSEATFTSTISLMCFKKNI